MDAKSLREVLVAALVEAKELHHVAVGIGVEKDEEWIPFYANVLEQRLRKVVTGMQAMPFWLRETVPEVHVKGTMTVDGHALPPFYTQSAQQEIGGQIASRLHVGE